MTHSVKPFRLTKGDRVEIEGQREKCGAVEVVKPQYI